MWSRTLNADGSKAGIPAPYSLARCWVAELVDAVEHCHAHNLVHRDLKPENLMLDARGPVSPPSDEVVHASRHSHPERRRGHVKLIDFGTSKDLVDSTLNGPNLCGNQPVSHVLAICPLRGPNSDTIPKRPTRPYRERNAPLRPQQTPN